MKDTITLAELRKTELYRKEQTRPLREFLMENIDVLKLADEVEMWGEDLLALNMRGGIPVIEGAKMLRQQKAEIEALKNAKRFIQNFAEEQHHRACQLEEAQEADNELVAWMGIRRHGETRVSVEKLDKDDIPLYTHPVKDLEDIDINITWNENSMRDFGKDELNFARAILRKAQEK